MDDFMDDEMDPLAMGGSGNYSGTYDSERGLSSMDNSDLFCTGKVRLQMAMEKSRMSGQPVVKHRNGKVDLGAVLDDPSSREFVCPYCSYSFAYKHVLERHVRQIHEKHLLCTYQCPKCTYSTVRKDQMRSHFSVVHEDFKPFNCSECNFRAPKAFRVTAHIAKNHGSVGAVIHDTNLKPRNVSPPPPEVIMQAKREMQVAKDKAIALQQQQSGIGGSSPHTTHISIDALPNERPQNNQIQFQLPELAPKTNKIQVSFPEQRSTMANTKIRILAPAPKPNIVVMASVPGFYCPHCDFKSDVQTIMGDHVVLNHVEEHIARNARVILSQTCTLCQKMVPTGAALQEHVRQAHPDGHVVVV